VRVLPLSASPAAAGELAAFLGRHLFLVYTGQTRLAKNLLQRVLRQWAMRENSITQTVAELRANAVAMAAALLTRDAWRTASMQSSPRRCGQGQRQKAQARQHAQQAKEPHLPVLQAQGPLEGLPPRRRAEQWQQPFNHQHEGHRQ
jgi:hypothetical protein